MRIIRFVLLSCLPVPFLPWASRRAGEARRQTPRLAMPMATRQGAATCC